MVTKTQTPDPETLHEQAAKLAAQAAAVQAEIDAEFDKALAKEREAQAKRNRKTVDDYDQAALDRAVVDAERAYRMAVAEMPVTKALAAYIAAGNARSWAHADLISALSSLGMSIAGAQAPGSLFVPALQDTVIETAGRLAQEITDAERGAR